MKKYIYLSVLIAVLLAVFIPFQFLLNFAHDDSFFYIKTANNFSRGLGSSFDGINHTNGYHPLYFLSLVLLFFIPNFLLKPSPEILFRLVILYHLILIICVQYFVFKSFKIIYKKEANKFSLLILPVLFSAFVFIRDFGLESHLACLIVSAFLYIKTKELSNNENSIIAKSFLVVALFLTRTDYLYSFIPLILFADYFLCTKKKKYIIISLTLLFLSAGLYYLYNYRFFGNPETVSGKILNSFPVINIKSNINSLIIDPAKYYNQFARIIIVFISFVIFGFYYFYLKDKKNIKSRFIFLLLCIGCGSVFFTLIHLFFNNYGIREWYMTLPVMVAIIMIIILVAKNRIVLNISLILSFMLLICVFYGSRVKNLKYVSGYEYAKSLNEIVKEEESILQVDYCGIVGFFSNRSVIDGDGLINSYEYLDYLKEGKIDDYISKHNVKYYSTYSTGSLLKDSVYTDKNFSDKVNGYVFKFPKSSLVKEQPFKWNHIAFDLEGNWYLFKFK